MTDSPISGACSDYSSSKTMNDTHPAIDCLIDDSTQRSLEATLGVVRARLLMGLPPDKQVQMLDVEALLLVRAREEEAERQWRAERRNPRLQAMGWSTWDLTDIPEIFRSRIVARMQCQEPGWVEDCLLE